MALVVGLGNPGARYARSRHNVAWRLVGRLWERWRAVPVEGGGGSYRAWRGIHSGRTVHLMTPLTFMNRSGEALEAWRAEHPVALDELLAIVDDVYLPVGVIRLRGHGSSGGHLGLESLRQTLGSTAYARLRIGVGAAASSAQLREHVLEEFGEEEERAVEQAIERAAEAVECWLAEGLRVAMNRFNRRVRKEESTP